MSPTDWSLTDELLALLRRWYLLAAAAMIGGLAGWITASTLPPIYESESALVVTFNNDAVFPTPDDFKNGQLAELSDFVMSDAVLEPTLDRLHQLDGLFADWTITDLREAIEPRWRNIGVWQLTARADEPGIAAVIAGTWSEVVLEKTAAALSAAAEFNEIDRRLTAHARSLDAVLLDHAVYTVLLREVEAWLASSQDLPQLMLLAGGLSNLETRSGVTALPPFDPESIATDPAGWAQIAASALRAELMFLEGLAADMRVSYDALGDEWLTARAATRGLSAYLLVERADGPTASPMPLYRRGNLTLAGAVIGVLALLVVRFGRIAIRER